MDTQEAIEFLQRLRHCKLGIKIDNLDDTINILKNYKGMLGDIKKALIPGGIFEGWYYQGNPFPKLSELKILREWLSNLEQKYFPKPVKKTITIEIEGEDDIELQLATVVMKKVLDDWDF